MESKTMATIERIDFIDRLHEQFLAATGYGAYAFLSSQQILALFNHYPKQQLQEQEFIKQIVKKFRY